MEKKIPKCHPNRAYHAKGICRSCYRDIKRGGPAKFRVNPINTYLVYLYVDENGTPLYVGRGTIDRVKSHKYPYKNSVWWSSATLLFTMTCKDEWEAMEYEGKWGGFYHPLYNKDGNRPFKDRHKRRVSVIRE